MTSPAAESDTNTSALGTTVNQRGCSNPLARTETLNPGGTCGSKSAGKGTTTWGLSVRSNLARMRVLQPSTFRYPKNAKAPATSAVKTITVYRDI